MIAFRREKNLRLVFEPAKRLAVDNAIAIALIGRAQIVFRLEAIAAARVRALRGSRDERVVLDLLERLANVHRWRSSSMNFEPAIGL